MGLDMYLNRVPKVSSVQELEEMNVRLDKAFINGSLLKELKAIHKEKNYIYSIDFSLSQYVDIDKYKKDPNGWGNIVNLEIRVAYWRKFNALHNWFVNNVQNGEDNCSLYIVTEQHLESLKNTLDKVNESNSLEIFPPSAGFFFGGTELDKYYWKNVEILKNTVNHLLIQDLSDTTLVYQSSW